MNRELVNKKKRDWWNSRSPELKEEMNKKRREWRKTRKIPEETRRKDRERRNKHSKELSRKSPEIKAQCIALKGGKCFRCNQSYPACVYDFHHRDEKQKKHEISRLTKDGRMSPRLLKELEKCDLLCANCHRIEHDLKEKPSENG